MSLNEQGLREQLLFKNEWPISRLEDLTLEEYTNLDRDTSFTYWLEKKTENTGSIWGGSAFKFGIYRRADTRKIQDYDNRETDGVYAWFKKYGHTRAEAFQRVKQIIIAIAKASSTNDWKQIDTLDLGESVKWKIAFHYNTERLVPIFKKNVLIRAAEKIGLPDAQKESISHLQSFLIEHKPAEESTIGYSQRLWNQFNVDNFYGTITKFLEQAQTESLKKSGFPKVYQGLDLKVSFGVGNLARIPWIAFLQSPNTVTDGIYPVYLYYKDIKTLILAYGLSETRTSSYKWENTEKLKSIEQWHVETYNKKPDRYGTSYVKNIYNLEEELDADRIQQDLNELIAKYKKQFSFDEPKIESKTDIAELYKAYWVISPGEQATKWEEFYTENVVGLSWNKIDDLRKFDERDAVRQQLLDEYPSGSKSQSNNSLALWEFSHEMKPGDIIIAKKGTSQYLGYGIIASDYYYDSAKSDYKHLRKVNWKKKGIWEESTAAIVIKTLTNISKYPEYVDRLKRLIGIEQDAELPMTIHYWWLNFSPSYWDLQNLEIGQTIRYKTINKKGIKRNLYQNFEKASPGDLVIAFETSPVNKAVGVLEITQELHINEDDGDEEISMLLQAFLPESHTHEELKTLIQKQDFSQLCKASIHSIEKENYDRIVSFQASIPKRPYLVEKALKEVFLDERDLTEILRHLQYKKNIILQGPPGTGKTFLAKRLAFLQMEEEDLSKIEMIQFHQSYAYEDFIQGYKPTDNGTFKLLNGVFYRFCKKAQSDPVNDYFFIIDEINRGNLSKIFGELMLLLESDKRGPNNAVSLTYGSGNDAKFFIPENVYVIGTMNTADRSIAVVDYALRRRFTFVDVNPSFGPHLSNELVNNGVDESIAQKIIERMAYLNEQIAEEQSLGEGFKIGHSYFCNFSGGTGDENWYQQIIKYEIKPLLNEYWFDNPSIVRKLINHLEK